MSLLAPWFAWSAAVVALATVAFHLLAWRRPPETPLPTARFAPDRPVRMVSRAIRPSDLRLLAVRVLLVLLVGLALAGPTLPARRLGPVRVVVADHSRGAKSRTAIEAAARSVFQPGDALIVFDSVAREIRAPTVDSIAAPVSPRTPGSLSAALIAAVRAAKRLEQDHDSVAIVLVSPFGSDELDAATGAIRETWAGPVRTMRAGAAPNDTSTYAKPAVRAAAGDPVAAVLTLAGEIPGGADMRVVRDGVSPADSLWAREGHVLVDWPASRTPSGWARRPSRDTAFAVAAIAGGFILSSSAPRTASVVAPFARAVVPPPGRITARWSDGEPAATESAAGTGCIRSVAVPVPTVGDLALTPAFGRFAQRMAERCAGGPTWTPVSDRVLAAVLPPVILRSEQRATMSVGASTSKLAAWLLGLALLVALAEMHLRRGRADATA